jgi:6-phosphogluconate dehydrogenase
MVHNGIEYAEMQLLAEVYQIFKSAGKNPDEISDILSSWKKDVDGYLLEITAEILKKKDNDDWLINKILDKAGNKGTGNWTTIASTELGVPSKMIAASLFARYISSYKKDRVNLSELYAFDHKTLKPKVEDVLKAYQLARIINHYQGFKLLNEASKMYDWGLNLAEIARIWTNGCIIRSTFMEDLISILKSDLNILINSNIVALIKDLKPSLEIIVSESIKSGLAVPCLCDAINSLNNLTLADSSANIIQAQRDYFGAHTYQRTDDNSEKYYHTNWEN